MAIPSGAGTEVLRRVAFEGKSNTTTPVLTVAANHIITILFQVDVMILGLDFFAYAVTVSQLLTLSGGTPPPPAFSISEQVWNQRKLQNQMGTEYCPTKCQEKVGFQSGLRSKSL